MLIQREVIYIIGIKDVAAAAGVSVATVSRVLSGAAAVSEKTEEAVRAAAKRLGYHPNLLGRNLRCNRTKVILVMLVSLQNTFCSSVIRGIEGAAEAAGYSIMVCVTHGLPESERKYLDFVRNRLADGIIILNSSLSGDEMRALSRDIPVVQCCEYSDVSDTPFVSIDNESAAYESVSRLIDAGRRKIAFIGVNNNYISSEQRLAGYKRALAEGGLPFDAGLVVWGNYGYRNALRGFGEFLDSGSAPDAVFAISDRMAAGAISALLQRGISIPEQVSVIGFDNTDITYMFTPKITTVAQPQTELGAAAFSSLSALIGGDRPENVILKHRLVIRESTTQI